MNQPAMQETTTEELYRTILNSSPDWLEWVGADYRDYFVSSAVFQITGYPSEDFIKKPDLIIEITHPDDREIVAKHRQEILSHNAGDCEFEYRIIHRSGELRWIHHHCRTTLNGGKWIGHHSTRRDITAQKKQEDELQTSYYTIKALMSNPMDGMMLIAPDGMIHTINPVMARAFGLPGEQLIGHNTYEISPPEIAEFQREMVRKVIETGAPIRYESKGMIGLADVTIYPIPDQKGNIFQIAITARDITKRIKGEQELHTSHKMISALMNAPTDVILFLDLDGKAILANQNLFNKLKLPPEKIIGQPISAFLPTELARDRQKKLEQVLKTGQPVRFEDCGVSGVIDNIVFPILDDEGKVFQIVVIGRDISDRKRAEDELLKSYQTIKALLGAPSDIACVIDLDGTIRLINDTYARMYQSTPEDLMGTRIWDLFPAERTQFRQNVFEQIRISKKTERVEDHSPLGIFDSVIQPIFDQQGEVVQVAILSRDITDRVRAEGLLREREALLRTVVENAPVILAVMNMHGYVTFIQGDIHQSNISSVNSVLGKNIQELDFIPNELINGFYQAVLGDMYSSDRMRIGDQTYNIQLTPVHHQNGEVVGVIGIGLDISEFLRIEDELRQSKKELELVLDHLKDAIGVFNREYELIYVNPAGVQMADSSSESELIEYYQQTKQIGVLDESGNPVDFSAILDRLFLLKTPGENEILLRTPTHPEERLINTQFIPVPNEKGDPLLMIMIARDITESRKAQEQIRAHQTELEQKITERTTELNRANQELRERILESQRAASHAETLARVAAHTSVLSELPAFLQMVCDETMQAINYNFSSIISYDEKTDAFYMAALSPQIELPRQYPIYSRTVLEKYIRTYGHTIIIPDIRTLPDYKGLDLLLLFGIRTLIILPMIANGEIFGTLNVASMNEVRLPDTNEINLLKALTDQATIGFTKAKLFEQISESRVRLQILSEKLVEVQELEKRNLASELHDEIGQSLTSLHLNLGIISHMIPETWNNQHDLREHLDRANQTVVRLLERVREISLDLRPAMLDDLGLIPALLALFERFSAQTQIRVLLKHNGVERRFAPKIETAAFRIIQEALTNVARHTQSTKITVRLWADSNYLRLQVEDDGGGFDPQLAMQQSLTSGLSDMAERAASCGGSLDIESEPGQGTCLSAEFAL